MSNDIVVSDAPQNREAAATADFVRLWLENG
jgi:hypothetical protein